MDTQTKRCRKHEWTRLYKQLPSNLSPDQALNFCGPVASDPRIHICRLCRVLGFMPRGYKRGGLHTVRPYQYQDAIATPDLFARADTWNTAIDAWAGMFNPESRLKALPPADSLK